MSIVLDLYSGAGGAAVGYARAGLRCIGVDIDKQRSYPYEFWRSDALTILTKLLEGKRLGLPNREKYGLEEFSLIHASPPCQTHSALTAGNRGRGWDDTHSDYIEETRELLDQTGLPYVIENVQGAPLRRDLTLCGEMFGLAVIRHRYFELGNWTATAPAHVPHRGRVAGWRHGVYYPGPYFAVYGDGGGKGSIEQWKTAMDIDWMAERHDLAEAIPPAYTQWIGERFTELAPELGAEKHSTFCPQPIH